MGIRVKRTVGTVAIGLVLFGLCFAVGVGMQMKAQDAAGIGSIKTSYSFDVTDTKKLMRYADDAFVGEVLGVEKTEAERSTTVWKVRVIDQVKGKVAGTVLVRQLGYVDKDSRAHVAEDQPLLVAGTRQLFVTTRTPVATELTLIGGPRSSVPVRDAAEQSRVMAAYRSAAR